MLLLQQRAEQLQPKALAWGRAEGSGLAQGHPEPLQHPSSGSERGSWGPSPPHQRSLSRIRHLPYSRALRVTRPLMPGLEVVVGTQAAIRSRRHSHIPRVAPLSRWTRAGRLPSAPGHLQDPGAGAEHMAEGTRPTQSPQHPHQLRPYIGAHRLTSAPVRTSGPPWCSSHQKPSLAQCVSQRGSRFPSCSPFVSLLGAREGEGPMRHHCRLWAARGWGHHHRPALVSQQEGTAHRDVQGPSSATVPCLGTTEEQKDGTTRGREMRRGCARGWVQALCSHSHLGEGCGSYRVRKPQDTAGSPRRRVTGRQGQSEREQNSVVPPKAPAGAEELSSESTAGGKQPTPIQGSPWRGWGRELHGGLLLARRQQVGRSMDTHPQPRCSAPSLGVGSHPGTVWDTDPWPAATEQTTAPWLP